jgi:hypothetical protein
MKAIKSTFKNALVFTFISATFVSCGKKAANQSNQHLKTGHIVGGEKVEAKEYSSVVGIVRNGRVMCTGNLINKNQIITAAHCLVSGQFSSKEQVLGYIKEVSVFLNKNFSDEEYKGLSKSEQRQAIKKAMQEHIESVALKTGIHFGKGSAGGQVDSKDIVASTTIPSTYIDHIFANIFGKGPLGVEADKEEEYTSIKDVVVLTLNREIEDITPVPLISREERDAFINEGDHVTAVGFGLKFDQRYLSLGVEFMRELKEKIEKENDPEKKAELKVQLEKEMGGLANVFMLIQNSGDKNKVRLKIKEIESENISLTATKEKTLNGACNGDSGGPVFVKLGSGEIRQLGVMVTVDFCGKTTNLAPVFNRQ